MKNKSDHFNRKASNPKNKPDEILNALEIKPGMRIADIGSGGGYFALRFAEAVGGEGRVYAVDTNQGYLERIGKDAEKKGLANVVTILAEESRPVRVEPGLDLVFFRNVFHHLSNRLEYFKGTKTSLNAGGKVAVIEYDRRGFFSFHRLFGHFVPKERIAGEMTEAGYRQEAQFDFLPEQSFTIFSPD